MLIHDKLHFLTDRIHQFIDASIISSVWNKLFYPELFLLCTIQEPKCFIKFLDDLLSFMLRNQLFSYFSFVSLTFLHFDALVKQVSFSSEFYHVLR